MKNNKNSMEMYLTKKIDSGSEKYTNLEVQLLYTEFENKKEFTLYIFNRLIGEDKLYNHEILIDPVNLRNYPDYMEDVNIKWIKSKIYNIYLNQAFTIPYCENESTQVTVELFNNLVDVIKGNEENNLENTNVDKLKKKIKENLKNPHKIKESTTSNSEDRTHLRDLDYQQNLILEDILKKYVYNYKFLANIIKWFYDEKFQRKTVLNLINKVIEDSSKNKYIVDTVYENNTNYIGEDEIRKKIDNEKDYDMLFEIINLSQLQNTRITHSISDNTSIISNPMNFKVEKEVITEHRGNVSYFDSTILEAIPIEIIRYDNRILQEPVTYKIKWQSKNGIFSIPSHEDGYNIKEIKEELINRGTAVNINDILPSLSALINEFENRKLLKVKKDIQKPGFYFDSENNKLTMIKFEIPEYKPDLIEAIKILETLKDYYSDNLDKLATILKWGWISPFFYAMKQKGNQSVCYLCLSGIADTGKTTAAEIILYLWDHPTEGVNEVSGAKAGSVARLGSIINTGTFPIIINETEDMFKRLNMVELIKTSVYGLISRSRFEGNVLKSFAALSPLIFTENGYLPEDDGIIRRFNELRYGLSERKTKKEKYAFQNDLQMNHHDSCKLNKLKSISYFITEEIINDPDLLDMDYEQIALILLHRLYSDLGYEFPDWLNKTNERYDITEMYDMNEETIRSFLANTINHAHVERISDATYNSDGIDRYLNLDREDGIDLRVDTVLSRQLVPWIIAKKNQKGDIIVCLTIEFAKQLKEQTGINHQLKTLGELMGFNYGCQNFNNKNREKRIVKKVIWKNLDDFKFYLFPDSEID